MQELTQAESNEVGGGLAANWLVWAAIAVVVLVYDVKEAVENYKPWEPKF